ncbi:hypothetical protein J5N97_025289 [Dioscorea zingiberensis]|uniref:Uncharacterized protein n=1 Tax=Dioscorea zingiberensis TaxID=325984 RepID=A0A9D5H9P4_9LILI|nr:hypothetical protein J5N97_025289 [Dioscorea zingiberensis]
MLRSKSSKPSSPAIAAEDACGGVDEWEVRPGGMLVQKRDAAGTGTGTGTAAPPVPNIRVRVKHGSAYLDLKKLLAERTGLHPLDQKLVYKGKDRDSSAYLDISGVKDRSKIVLLEDSTAQAKRFLEMRRSAKMEKATKSISQISLEVDKLALQVSALDAAVSKGGKVVENDVLNLIELLMAQLIKLDGITADGEAKQQRGMQVRRVQKYVERLDVLKIKSNNAQQQKQQQSQPQKAATLDFFDSLFAPATPAASTTTTVSSASSAATPSSNPQGTPLPLILLGKSKNALLSTFLFLDQFVWAGRTGIYKNKEKTELIGRISLFCWMGSSICTSVVELAELIRLSSSMKKLEKDQNQTDEHKNEQYLNKLKQSNERLLALIKSSMDIVVAIGLLQLAPKTVNSRFTGAFGFITSLISCYQLLPCQTNAKAQ